MTSQRVERTWIRTGGYGRFRGEWVKILKTFPTKMKPTKCPAREKKMRQEKRKKRGGEKDKVKDKNLEICLSAHV